MAGHLAAVPEESTNGFTAPHTPRNVYRKLIQGVVASGGHFRSTLFSHSSHNGSSSSSHNGSSYSSQPGSNYSGCSSAMAADVKNREILTADLGAQELTEIAHRMVSDGYTQSMVRAYSGGLDHVLESWFFELDVDWVLRIARARGSWFKDMTAPFQVYSAEMWIRALTIIAVSMKEVIVTVHETSAVTRLCKASISAMLVFVDAVVSDIKVEKLGVVLDMFVCVSGLSHLFTPVVISTEEAESTFNEIGVSLEGEGNRLKEAIFSTMEEVRTHMEDDYLWAIGIPQGKGEVHRNTCLMVNCIISMVKAQGSTQKSAWSHDIKSISDLIDDSVHYLKDLLLRKSELCSEPSLRYMFLLNNSYFVALLVEPWSRCELGPTPECEKYMNSYLDVSWGPVQSRIPHMPKTAFIDGHLDGNLDDSRGRGQMLFCIPKKVFDGPLQRWKNTSPLAKFKSAFHKTYRSQKFWKVPNPQLRDTLRKAIIERVITGYRNYLEEHPELEKHVSGGSSSPDVLEEMLGELFEG